MTTRYEVALTTPAGTRRLGFSAHKTKAALLAFARGHSETILGFLAPDEDPVPSYNRAQGWYFGPCRVHFTGETEKGALS